MIPLKDDNPTSGRPLVTYFLIAACVLIFLIQFSSESYRSGQLFYSYGLIPSVLMGHNQLPMDLYAVPAYLTIFFFYVYARWFYAFNWKHALYVDFR